MKVAMLGHLKRRLSVLRQRRRHKREMTEYTKWLIFCKDNDLFSLSDEMYDLVKRAWYTK